MSIVRKHLNAIGALLFVVGIPLTIGMMLMWLLINWPVITSWIVGIMLVIIVCSIIYHLTN